MELHRDLGITSPALRSCCIASARPETTDAERFAAPVADETFVGGKAKNNARRASPLGDCRPWSGRQGDRRGGQDRATNKLAAAPVADTSIGSLLPFVVEYTASDAKVFTDEHGSYRPLASLGYCHAAVAHSVRYERFGTMLRGQGVSGVA